MISTRIKFVLEIIFSISQMINLDYILCSGGAHVHARGLIPLLYTAIELLSS